MNDQDDLNDETQEKRSPSELAFEKIMKEINDEKQENDEESEDE